MQGPIQDTPSRISGERSVRTGTYSKWRNRHPSKHVQLGEKVRCILLRPVFVVCAAFAFGPLAGPVLPQPIGPSANLLAPGVDRDGRIIVFGATVNPDGTRQGVPDLWIWNSASGAARRLTDYASSGGSSAVTSFALSADGSQLAYVASSLGGQVGEIHVMDAASGFDRLLATDKQGCVQPLVICLDCFFPCVQAPHFTADGRVLYAASRSQPFNLVSADGTVTPLPVYSGYLPWGPQRVISDNGLLVFVSSMPSGPPNGPVAQDVYLINLDGSGLVNLTEFSNVDTYAQNAVISANGRLRLRATPPRRTSRRRRSSPSTRTGPACANLAPDRMAPAIPACRAMAHWSHLRSRGRSM